jgi:hypothetical protein
MTDKRKVAKRVSVKAWAAVFAPPGFRSSVIRPEFVRDSRPDVWRALAELYGSFANAQREGYRVERVTITTGDGK